MTAPGAQNGPLTAADIQAIWEGATDPGYSEPLEMAGEGNGFEAWTQMFQQFARVSEAIDISTQAMYILPGSGQSNPPASRAEFAVVELSISRGEAYVQWALTFVEGQILVGEVTQDWGPTPGAEGVPVQTGREYVLLETLTLPPGDMGPYTVLAQAQTPGYGYNNPLPATITLIDQPGNAYTNLEAFVTAVTFPSPASTNGAPYRAILTAQNIPDMFLPNQLGQYVAITAGENLGKIARIAGYVAANPAIDQGSGVLLAYEQAVECTTFAGTFQAGEALLFKNGATLIGTGKLIGVKTGGAGIRIVYELQTGDPPSPAQTVTGVTSTATATVSLLMQPQVYTSTGNTEGWRILDWALDLNVSVTNEFSPVGGLSPMLDELGSERAIPAGAGENSNTYRRRVAQVADTVAPNAIRRTTAKALGQLPWCFREVGNPTYLPGLYFDKDPKLVNGVSTADYYDTNCLLMTGNFLTQLAGTFSPTGGSATVGTTSSQVGFVAPGQWVYISDQPVFPYQVKSVTSSTVVLTQPYKGLTNTGLTMLVSIFAPGESITWLTGGSFGFIGAGIWGGPLSDGSTTAVFIVKGFRLPSKVTGGAGDALENAAKTRAGTISTVTQPSSAISLREHVWLDYLHMRAYFQIGVPPNDNGEFGFFYDGKPLQHTGGFYDEKVTGRNFYDGYPVAARGLWRALWADIERVRAGGTVWDLYEERVGCP